MSVKIKRNLAVLAFCLFSSAVVAAVERNGVIVFFLPAQDHGEITSVQQAVPTKVATDGAPKEMKFRDSVKNPDHEKHGIPTKAGVSLYDKGKLPLERAAENIVMPAKVLILPPDGPVEKAGKKTMSEIPESVLPYRLRVFPMKNPVKEVKKEARELPAVQYEFPKPPADVRKRRPTNEEYWQAWALGELEKCEMDAQTVLPTLYWLSANGKLDKKQNECVIKEAVAVHLKKCHPWPVVYYTPVNNDVPVRPPVQMAVEYLETEFERNDCPSLDLTGINFERTEFVKGSLKNADFSGSYFHEAVFDGINLSETLFKKALLDNVLFRDVNLSGSVFEKAGIKYSHFHSSEAVSVNFNKADMQNTQFRDTTLTFSSFADAVLQNTGWRDVRAYRIFAPRADFSKAGFDNVILDQLQADKANFENISCKNCVLKNASLENAYFYGAFFENTSFDRARLSKADFRSAVFGDGISLKDADVYKADFSGADLKRLSGWPLTKMAQTKIDRKTAIPEELSPYDVESYETALDESRTETVDPADRYSCTPQMCRDRLLGRAANQNLAVRAMTMLTNPKELTDNQLWALCTIGCIAKHDRKLENSQIDILAAYVKHKAPWNAQKDLFKPYAPVLPEVQMALYLLTDPDLKRDLGHDVDLTGTDLRTADLSNGDLRNVNLAGSNLGGASLLRSKTDNTYARFDRAVIDEYTRLPKNMKAFQPFSLPRPNWKPSKIRVYRDGTHLWTVTTELLPFADKFVVTPENKAKK